MSYSTPPSRGRTPDTPAGSAEPKDPGPAARLRILVDTSRLLAEAAPNLRGILDIAATQISQVLGDAAVACLRSRDGAWLDPIAIRHRSPERRVLLEEVNRTRRIRPYEGLIGRAITSGASLFIPDIESAVLRGVVLPQHRPYLDRVGVRSLLVVPLSSKGRVHGALWLARDPESLPYTEEDRELVEALADSVALAMDRAQLYETQREGQRRVEQAALRTARLQEVTSALSGAATPEEVAKVIAELAVGSMEGAAGSLLLPAEARDELQIVANIGHAHTPHLIERFRRLPVGTDNPAARAFREGTAFYFEDLARYVAAYPALAPEASEAGYQAAAALPLVARGETLGVVWVRFLTPRAFTPDERALMSTMIAQCAQALERSRLYLRAQQAITLRDEFLSVAAHELRTPLTAMKLQVQSLQREVQRPSAELVPERLHVKVESVARQVGRLEALVDDLLDLSRLTAGKLPLRVEDVDLLALVREVSERMGDEIARSGCTLALRGVEPVIGRWDKQRLDQVVSNLLANAAKYGAGKPIEVAVEADAARAWLRVRDAGIGIASEDHARIFERFERAASGRHYGGFGVGLWICRQIVVALGGIIRVSSRLGEGATFEVELPRAETPPG